jgi:hypothetical protein
LRYERTADGSSLTFLPLQRASRLAQGHFASTGIVVITIDVIVRSSVDPAHILNLIG